MSPKCELNQEREMDEVTKMLIAADDSDQSSQKVFRLQGDVVIESVCTEQHQESPPMESRHWWW